MDSNLKLHLDQIEDSINNCYKTTENIYSELHDFDKRFTGLSDNMRSMNNKIIHFQTANTNIEEAIHYILGVRERIQFTNEIGSKITESNCANNVEQFIEYVEQIAETMNYFKQHPKYIESKKAIELLSEHKKSAIQMLDDEFKKMIGQTKTEIIPTETLQKLHLIAKSLHHQKKLNYRKYFIDARKQVFKTFLHHKSFFTGVGAIAGIAKDLGTLKLIQNAGNNALLKGEHMSLAAKFTKKAGFDTPLKQLKAQAQEVLVLPGGGDEREDNKLNRFYQQGTYPFITYMKRYKDALKQERELVEKLIFNPPYGSNIDSPNDLFFQIIEKSRSEFFQRAAEIGNDVRDSEAIFVILDVLHHFKKIKPEFDRVIGLSDLEEFHNELEKRVPREMDVYKKNIGPHISRSTPNAGQVHEVTSASFLFFKRLLFYRDVVDDILKIRFELKGRDKLNRSHTFIGKEIRRILTKHIIPALKEKMNDYHNPQLGHLFLLNNYFFIYQQLSSQLYIDNIKEHDALEIQKSYKEEYALFLKESFGDFKQMCQFMDIKKQDKLKSSKKGPYRHKKVRKMIKNRFAAFNAKMQTLLDLHKNFVVNDAQIRVDLRTKVSDMVIKHYSKMYNQFKNVPFSVKNMDKYLQFDPDELTKMFLSFYE